MRYFLTSILILITLSEPRAQAFNSIEIIAREHGEPPTREGPVTHVLELALKEGRLTPLKYSISDVVTPFQVEARSNAVDSMANLLEYSTRRFLIQREIGGESLQPIELNLDSLDFCKSYIQKRVISTGGMTITVKVNSGSNEILNFKYDSSRPQAFDFQKYLTLYPVLQKNLPEDMPGAYIFDELFLFQKVSEYFEIIQCEDFYYQEFVNNHPERTNRQNRTREGWNFKEYLKSKGGN